MGVRECRGVLGLTGSLGTQGPDGVKGASGGIGGSKGAVLEASGGVWGILVGWQGVSVFRSQKGYRGALGLLGGVGSHFCGLGAQPPWASVHLPPQYTPYTPKMAAYTPRSPMLPIPLLAPKY